jgi:hypothetical protein
MQSITDRGQPRAVRRQNAIHKQAGHHHFFA